MEVSEATSLLGNNNENTSCKRLSLFFAMVCVIDVFGVFPIIALPKAIINCGLYGILVLGVVCSFQVYTAILLGRSWVIIEKMYPLIHRKNRYPYSALAEVTYGKYLANCVNFILDLTIFSGGIPNLIVASQNLQLLGLRISEGNVDISDCYWMIIVGMALCPILWLGSPKDMKCICTLSVFIVLSVFILTIGCLLFTGYPVENEEALLQSTNEIPMWQSILTTYGIIAFQFDIHPTILTIQVDMKEKTRLPKAIILAYIVTLSMLGTTTVAAAFKYGANTQQSILETLPSTVFSHIAAILTTAQLCLTSAVSNNALYQHMEDCLCISREFNSKRCILRSILTIMAVILAESVPRFDLVMSFIGGTLTGPLMFILPPLFYIKVLTLQTQHEEQLAMQSFTNIVFTKDSTHSSIMSKYMEQKFREDLQSSLSLVDRPSRWISSKQLEKLLCMFIILASSVATVATTYINFTKVASSYSSVDRPCIYNVSSALLYL